MNFKGAIFDFDGTLIDSMPLWRNIAYKWSKKYNIELTDEIIEKIMYSTLDETESFIKNMYPDINAKYAVLKLCLSAIIPYVFKTRTIEGAAEYIRSLKQKNIPIALITNCPPVMCKAALFRHGLKKYIDVFLFTRELKLTKDNPEIFVKAADALGIKSSDCMVFEDSHIALNGAHMAGMKFTAVYEKTSKHADYLKENSDRFIVSYNELINK